MYPWAKTKKQSFSFFSNLNASTDTTAAIGQLYWIWILCSNISLQIFNLVFFLHQLWPKSCFFYKLFLNVLQLLIVTVLVDFYQRSFKILVSQSIYQWTSQEEHCTMSLFNCVLWCVNRFFLKGGKQRQNRGHSFWSLFHIFFH